MRHFAHKRARARAGAWVAGAWLCASGGLAHAQVHEDAPLLEELGEPTPDQGEPQGGAGQPSGGDKVFVAEFGLDERNVVLSAAKSRATIQEVPAIVTVLTADEIRARGYRTLNDLLQTVPGFEGDRWEFNGWTQESFARGNPRGLLVLLNGVNIVDPSRNQATLDRKIPMEAIARVEIVSGPGGVLWGSNALLGIVNVITKTSDDLDGFEVIAGAGGGRGEQQAGKLSVSYGGTFWDDRIKLYSNLSLFTSLGPELTVDSQKVVGILPAPADDGVQLFVAEPGTTSNPSREYFFNWIGNLSLGDFSLEWMVPWERDARQVAGSGALLTEDLRADTSQTAFDTESIADDGTTVLAAKYQGRFWEDRFGLSAKAFFVRLKLREDPLGVFPPSDVSPRTQVGVFTRLEDQGMYRYGFNLDTDVGLTAGNKLLVGGEVLQDRLQGALTTAPLSARVKATLDEDQLSRVTTENGVELFTEDLITPITRTIGALYVVDEADVTSAVKLSGGARLQLSDAYDPAVLFQGALVWNLLPDTFAKINYAEGFRPPEFQSTSINGEAVNQITFQPNPDLKVESSRAIEAEVNTVVLKGGRWVDQLYLRGDYSLTLLNDVIVNEGGKFRNSGTRLIHSVELLGRLELRGEHELWAAYTFVTVDDSELGTLRNVANHIVNVGARAFLWPELWDASALLTVIGPREDRNRFVDPTRAPLLGYTPVYPTDIFIEELEPVYLLRLGTRLLDLWEVWTFSGFAYNALDQDWSDPDLFFDDGSLTRPYPKPGWSFFLQAEARF